MNEETPGNDRSPASRLDLWITVAIGLLSVAFVSLKVAMSGVLSFDGGLNFSVANQLLESGTYARDYSGLHPFPIATDSIFIFLAALNTLVFGTSPAAAEIPNALFVLAMFVLLFRALFPGHSLPESAAIAFSTTLVPGFALFGFSGYGEVPMFALMVGSLLLISAGPSQTSSRIFIAGLVAGQAVSMKVVALISFPSFAVLIVLLGIAHRGWLAGALRVALFCLGALFSYALWESYRLLALGFDNWMEWWRLTSTAITDRAGITSGLADTPSFFEKLSKHIAQLGNFYDLPTGITFVIVVFIVAGAVVTVLTGLRSALLAKGQGTAATGLVTSNAVFFGCLAASYLGWWLVLTPTEQAWLRRVFPGLVATHLFVSIILAAVFRKLTKRRLHQFARWRIPVLGLAIATGTSVALSLRVSKGWSASEAQRRSDAIAIATLNGLPADAQLFGIGWYAAPQWSFHSNRRLTDLALTPFPAVNFDKAYLILDHNAVQVMGEPEKRIFRYPSVLPLYLFERIDAPFGMPRLLRIVGVQPLLPAPEGLPERWNDGTVPHLLEAGSLHGVRLSRHGLMASTLVEGWIDPKTTRRVTVSGSTLPKREYVNSLSGLAMPDEGRITVLLDGAVLHVERLALPTGFHFEVVIPPPVQPNSPASRLSITSDFVRTRTGTGGPQDPAQLSYVLSEVVFGIE